MARPIVVFNCARNYPPGSLEHDMPRLIEACEVRLTEAKDGPDLARCWVQKAPARSLPNLAKVQHLVVTSEASYHANYDHCTVKYLEQAGVHPTFMKLADLGIKGNGHMMMLEKNNQEIARAMSDWLAKSVRDDSKKTN